MVSFCCNALLVVIPDRRLWRTDFIFYQICFLKIYNSNEVSMTDDALVSNEKRAMDI